MLPVMGFVGQAFEAIDPGLIQTPAEFFFLDDLLEVALEEALRLPPLPVCLELASFFPLFMLLLSLLFILLLSSLLLRIS